MKQQDRSSDRNQVALDFAMKIFFYFFSLHLQNLRAKSIPKKVNTGFGAKYSTDRCHIPNSSGFGCVSVPPPKFFPPPPNTYCTVLFAVHNLYCGLLPDSQRIIFICCTKCLHFEEISRKTVFEICTFLAIYRTLIIAFSLKRYCSKSAVLKSVLSVQIDPLLDHIICSTSIEKKLDHVR